MGLRRAFFDGMAPAKTRGVNAKNLTSALVVVGAAAVACHKDPSPPVTLPAPVAALASPTPARPTPTPTRAPDNTQWSLLIDDSADDQPGAVGARLKHVYWRVADDILEMRFETTRPFHFGSAHTGHAFAVRMITHPRRARSGESGDRSVSIGWEIGDNNLLRFDTYCNTPTACTSLFEIPGAYVADRGTQSLADAGVPLARLGNPTTIDLSVESDDHREVIADTAPDTGRVTIELPR
jgi:hypothetical protein